MNKFLISILIAAASTSAFSMQYFLTKQWMSKDGNNMCEYSNGTVLNVGYRICPLSIEQ